MAARPLQRDRALALFVGWPAEDPDGEAVRQALRQALARALAGRRLISLLIDADAVPSPGAIERLFGDLHRCVAIAPDLEATLAIDVEAAGSNLAAWRGAGINRLALRAGVLTPAAENVLAAAGALLPVCAVDLSFGRPGQTVADWRRELLRAKQLGACHLSVEEHAPPAADGDHLARLYREACGALGTAGMLPYEIAHFAAPGRESVQLLHGATGGDYLGVGPGAVGRISAGGICHALSQPAPAAAWLRAVAAGDEMTCQPLGAEQRRTELVLTGLRLRTGIERAWFEPLTGDRLEAAFEAGRLAALVEDGFVVLDRRGLRLGARGWPLCDAVLRRLLA